MLKRLLIATVLVFGPNAAQAGNPLLLGTGTFAVTSAACTTDGPGDCVSGATAWWGLRPYTTSYSGNIVDVCDVATGAICGTATASGGVVTFPLISGLSCNGAISCNISKFYDQSGSNKCNSNTSPCDVAQSTNANRPLLVFNCLGALPCARGTIAAATYLVTATTKAVVNQPYTVSSVSRRTGSFTSQQGVGFSVTTNDAIFGFTSSTNTVFMAIVGQTSLTASASDSAAHAFQMVYNSASSDINVDNTRTTGTVAVATAFGPRAYTLMSGSSASNHFTGDFFEVGIWGSAFSSTQETNMCHNQFIYWGTATSC